MCGRFTLHQSVDTLIDRFEVQGVLFPELMPRYNIAPTQAVAAITGHGPSVERLLEPLQWGLVPFWSKDTSFASKCINARAETITEKPSFKTALGRSRCLILADGFYEWDRKTKQPYYFHRADNAPFAMAGLFDEWQSPDGSPLRTCTIVTTEANGVLAPHHERMPVIFPHTELEAIWLDTKRFKPADVVPFLVPLNDALLAKTEVSKRVGTASNDDPTLIEAL